MGLLALQGGSVCWSNTVSPMWTLSGRQLGFYTLSFSSSFSLMVPGHEEEANNNNNAVCHRH